MVYGGIMGMDKNVLKMLDEFSKLEEVDAIMIAGSHGTNTSDKNSDYDVYIYTSKEIDIAKRKVISDKYFSYIELNNTFWETEDDGILKEGNIPVEIIYRDLKWIDGSLKRTVIDCQSDIGYTTCFWSNIINSIIIYDREGKLTEIQKKYNVEYPEKLKQNIIDKNYQLLKEKMPAYYYQIEKALKRDDFISVNHRVAAFFASYFDIIFAVNKFLHPGEKKILKIIKDNNLITPDNMENDVLDILRLCASNDEEILVKIDSLIKNLDKLIK